MLPLRFGIFAGLVAIALWGLFSLLDNLREPELLRTPKAIVVKGCEPMQSDAAKRVCPRFLCYKALLDTRQLPISTHFENTADQRDERRHLLAGLIHADKTGPQQAYACLLENGKVVASRLIDTARLAELASQPGDWTL